jgi:hypothetical protein
MWRSVPPFSAVYWKGMPERSERPTIPPTFDVARYAKESDARVVTAQPAESDEELEHAFDSPSATPCSEVRLVTRPDIGAVATDETWARTIAGMPVVVMSASALKRLPLDHRVGFLMSLMDGAMDLETLVEIAGMPRVEVLRAVRDLFESGVVEFR